MLSILFASFLLVNQPAVKNNIAASAHITFFIATQGNAVAIATSEHGTLFLTVAHFCNPELLMSNYKMALATGNTTYEAVHNDLLTYDAIAKQVRTCSGILRLSNKIMLPVKPVYINFDKDIMVLYSSLKVNSIASLSMLKPQIGDQIYSISFRVFNNEIIDNPHLFFDFIGFIDKNTFEHRLNLTFGDSGSGIYTNNGKLVGLASREMKEGMDVVASRYGLSVNIQLIKTLLPKMIENMKKEKVINDYSTSRATCIGENDICQVVLGKKSVFSTTYYRSFQTASKPTVP